MVHPWQRFTRANIEAAEAFGEQTCQLGTTLNVVQAELGLIRFQDVFGSTFTCCPGRMLTQGLNMAFCFYTSSLQQLADCYWMCVSVWEETSGEEHCREDYCVSHVSHPAVLLDHTLSAPRSVLCVCVSSACVYLLFSREEILPAATTSNTVNHFHSYCMCSDLFKKRSLLNYILSPQ